MRLDFSDVKVALTEEGFFKPVFDWHQQRGMIYGCDHGGRGRTVDEFGDYFRTQRWNQGPGADQPGLGKDLIKAKVAASIAHLYERPRVWLEGYHSLGWGATPATAALEVSRPRPGFSEQDPAQWWAGVVATLDEIKAKAARELAA